jgi:methyl-accepting chemotaxis protein
MSNLRLSSRLFILVALLLTLAVALGVMGIVGMQKTTRGLETVYNDRVIPLQQLKMISDDYAVFIIDAANKANAGLMTASEAKLGIEQASGRIRVQWAAYMSTTLTPDESRLAADVEQMFVPANAAVDRLRNYLATAPANVAGQMGDFDGPLYPVIDPLTTKITDLVNLQLDVARQEYTGAMARYRTVFAISVALLIGGALAGGLLGWLTVKRLSAVLEHTAAGISMGADQTTSAAQQVATTSGQLAAGTSEQATSIEQTNVSLAGIAEMTARNAESAGQAASLTGGARATVESGAQDAQALSAAMAAVKESSDSIATIIRTIDEIAFQTNLLALNAAVEAARAGDAGRGFAVVAEEVRGLAQRSAKAASETTTRIQESIARSGVGVKLSGQVELRLQDVLGNVRQVDELVGGIAKATREQSLSLQQLTSAVAVMDNVTQGNAASAEESAAAAEELSAQAESMRAEVRALRVLLDGAS